MHENSLKLMSYFRKKYVDKDATVLDVGSQNINGSYRSMFTDCSYVGLDTIAGEGVDIVAEKEDKFPFDEEKFDCVISGQTLEHTSRPWVLVKEMARVLKNGGVACWIAPWRFPVHKGGNCPLDCWRILEDGMRQLMKEAGLETLECFQDDDDTVGIGIKRAPLKETLSCQY